MLEDYILEQQRQEQQRREQRQAAQRAIEENTRRVNEQLRGEITWELRDREELRKVAERMDELVGQQAQAEREEAERKDDLHRMQQDGQQRLLYARKQEQQD
jgi:hypothetical protein